MELDAQKLAIVMTKGFNKYGETFNNNDFLSLVDIRFNNIIKLVGKAIQDTENPKFEFYTLEKDSAGYHLKEYTVTVNEETPRI